MLGLVIIDAGGGSQQQQGKGAGGGSQQQQGKGGGVQQQSLYSYGMCGGLCPPSARLPPLMSSTGSSDSLGRHQPRSAAAAARLSRQSSSAAAAAALESGGAAAHRRCTSPVSTTPSKSFKEEGRGSRQLAAAARPVWTRVRRKARHMYSNMYTCTNPPSPPPLSLLPGSLT